MKQKTRNSVKYDTRDLVCGSPALADAIDETGISDEIIRDVVEGFRERFVVRQTDVKYVITRLTEAQIENSVLLNDLARIAGGIPDSIIECGHYVEFESDRIAELRITDGNKILEWSQIFPRLQRVSESIVGSEQIPASHLAKVALNEFFNGVRLNYALYAGKSLNDVAVIWRKRFQKIIENIGNGRLIIQMVDPGVKELNREMYELAESSNFFVLVTDGISFEDTRRFIDESVDMQSMFKMIAERYGQAKSFDESNFIPLDSVEGVEPPESGKTVYLNGVSIESQFPSGMYLVSYMASDSQGGYRDHQRFDDWDAALTFAQTKMDVDIDDDYNESIHVMFKENHEFILQGTELMCRKLKSQNLIMVQADIESWTEARNVSGDFDFAPWDQVIQERWDASQLEEKQFLVSQHDLATQPSKEWETLNEADRSILRRIL